jgi:hypothetical protein
VRVFSTWALVAVAAIGKLPETIEDRSVECRMRRRKPGERVESFRIDRTDHLVILGRKAARWAADFGELLRDADPEMGELPNRVG